MTRSFSPQGIPTEDVAAYYRRRAEVAQSVLDAKKLGFNALELNQTLKDSTPETAAVF